MVKKIGAILLALVLCLSVMLVPTTAAGFPNDYELADGQLAAVRLELDKEYVSAGDTITVSVYLKLAEGLELTTSALVFGINSAVFDTTTNKNTVIKASAVGSDSFNLLYKPATGLTWAVLKDTSTNGKKVEAANTAEENALYDNYIKVSLARNTDGNYDTVTGLPAEEIGDDPILTFKLTVADGVADGTAVNIGMTSGAWSSGQAYIGYIAEPGVDGTAVKPEVSEYDSTNFVATATVGKATPELTIVKDKTQINFDVDGNKLYEGKFAIRQFVEFDNLLDVFGTVAEAKDGADGTGLTEVGFVYATTDSYKKADALAVIDDNTKSGTYGAYTLDNDAYISTTSKANSFVMGYTVNNIADASVSLTILAYAKYVVNGEEAIATIEIAGDYSDIYSTYESKIPPVNPEA